MFYAYVYVDPRDSAPFYVGKGKGYRARKHLHQTTNPGMAARLAELKAAGVAPQIGILPCASSHESLEVEAALIAAFGRLVDGGTLVNRSPGGSDGMGGKKHNEESKAKIRAAMRARVMSPEHKEKIRAKARLRTFNDVARQRAIEWELYR